MASSLPATTKTQEFWRWFESVADQLNASFDNPDIVDELNERVTNMGAISWELGPGVNTENSLVITPDGDPDWLPATRFIVDMAPALPKWEFHWARPPKQWYLEFSIERSNGEMLDVDAREWRYVLFHFPDRTFDIVVEQPNLARADANDRWMACVVLIDGLLGEATRLSFIGGMEPVPTLPPDIEENATPIQRLPAHFDSSSPVADNAKKGTR